MNAFDQFLADTREELAGARWRQPVIDVADVMYVCREMVRGPGGRIHCIRPSGHDETRPRPDDARRRDGAVTVDQAVAKALSLIEARDYVSFAEFGRGFSRSCGNTGLAEGRRKAHELIASNFRGRMKHAFTSVFCPVCKYGYVPGLPGEARPDLGLISPRLDHLLAAGCSDCDGPVGRLVRPDVLRAGCSSGLCARFVRRCWPRVRKRQLSKVHSAPSI
jgi:hypothetical protein